MNLMFPNSYKPVLALFIITLISFLGYEYSINLKSARLYHWTAGITGVVEFICIGFGALFVYTAAFKNSAPVFERITASCFVPFLWATKEVMRIYAAYTFFESLYFYLSPLTIGVFLGLFAQMGLAEMILKKKVSFFPLSVFIACLSGVVFIFAWGYGEYCFYIFLDGFHAIFGKGQGIG